MNDNLFIHLVERLALFSKDGSKEAKSVLYEQYQKLIMKRKFNKIDAIRLDYLCVSLLNVDGLRFVKYHFKSIKNITNKISLGDLGWLYEFIVHQYKEKGKNLIKEVYPDYPKEIKFHFEQEDFTLNNLLNHIMDDNWFRRFSFFILQADKTEKAKVINHMIECEDVEVKLRLLIIVKQHEVSNYRITDVIAMIGKYGNNVDKHIYSYCAEVKDIQCKELGYSLLGEKALRAYGLQMIIQNYENKDKELVIKYTKKIKVDYDETEDWFYLYDKVLSLLDNKKKNFPTELLRFIYRKSLYSSFRERAIEIMKKRGILDNKILLESLYDSDWDISKKAKRILKKQSVKIENF